MQRTTGRRRFLQTGAVALVGSSFAGRAWAQSTWARPNWCWSMPISTLSILPCPVPRPSRSRATVSSASAPSPRCARSLARAPRLSMPAGDIAARLHRLPSAPIGEILLYETLVGDPYAVEFVTIAAIQDKLRERAAKTPAGNGCADLSMTTPRFVTAVDITRADLDAVSTEHPVFVMHRGGHSIYVNSKALELAGITRDRHGAFGGSFDRDAKGDLNGRVTDTCDAALAAPKSTISRPGRIARRAR